MKKKLIVTAVSIVCVLAAALGLFACGDKDKPSGKPTVERTVVFDANGGKFGDADAIDGELSSDGSKLTVTVTTDALDEPSVLPERELYALSGWAKDESGSTLWNFQTDRLKDKSTTLYAVWNKSLDFAPSADGSYYAVRGIGALSGDIEIPETYNRKPVKEILPNAFKNSRALTGVVIPNSVTTIGNGAFKNATKLASAKVGDGVTRIPEEAFCDCTELAELYLPKSLKEIDYSAFGVDGIRSILEVRYAGTVDEWCGIDMDCSTDDKANPLANGKAELYINGQPVSEITVNTEQIKPYAFYGCGTVTSVTIGKKVKEIGEKSFFMSKITSLDFAADSALERIGNSAFESTKITSLALPNGVQSVGNKAFRDCQKITSLHLGGAKIIGEEAFSNCFSVNNLNLGKVEQLGVGALSFSEDSTITSVTVPETVWYIGRGCFGGVKLNDAVFSGSAATAMWQVQPIRTDDPAEELTGAQLNASKLKEGGTWTRLASSLTYRDNGSGYSVSGVVDKSGVGALFIPKMYGGKNVTAIDGDAFKNFDGLRSLSISETVSQIGDGFIDGCGDLIGISVAVNNNSYASRNGMLYKKNGAIIWVSPQIGTTLASGDVRIPAGVKSIPAGLFAGRNIWNLVIPSSVTEIATGAFDGCPIKMADIPAMACAYVKNPSLEIADITSGTEIKGNAFKDCSSLKKVFLPDALTTINDNAFDGCVSLQTITVPKSVSYIGDNAFDGCNALIIYCEVENMPNDWCSDWNGGNLPVIWDCNNNDLDESGYLYVAIDGMRYGLKDKEATFIKPLDYSGGVVTVPDVVICSVDGEKTEFKVTAIGDGAFDGCMSLTGVKIGKNVAKIGDRAFADSSIVGITVPDSVTSIGKNVFEGCADLESIVIGSGVANIGDDAFGKLVNLKSVKLGDGVNSIGKNAFLQCTSLESVVLGSGLESIGAGAFSGCSSLTSIIIPNGVTSIGEYAFANASNLILYCEAEKKPDGWSSYYKASQPEIWNCKKNDKDKNGNAYTVANGLRFSVKDGKAAVYKFPGLKGDIVIPSAVTYKNKTYKVTSTGSSVFSGNSDITDITLPNTITAIDAYTFSGCTSVTRITIPGSVLSIGDGAFQNCTSLENIEFENGITSIGYSAFQGCTSVKEISLPNSLKKLGPQAFSECSSLLNIKLSDGITEIGDYAFYNCTSLKNVALPKSIDEIGNSMFEGCGSLTGVTIPNGVKRIEGSAFKGCANLTDLTIPDSVTDIGPNVFNGCDKITEKENGVYYIGKWVVGCEKTATSVNLRSGTLHIGGAFFGCKSLTDISIPDGVVSISGSAFYNCQSLIGIAIPNTVKTIGSSAFQSCHSLTSVKLPDSLTQITHTMFADCTSLTNVTIPKSVTFIDELAFYDCGNLNKIIFKGTEGQWNKIKKVSGWDSHTGKYSVDFNG